MRILVTNDDGIDAVGLRALARAVAGLGHGVIVVAPLDDRSGAGAGLVYVPDAPIATTEKCFDDVPGVRFIGIEGTPALAVMPAGLGMFGPRPWCVVAGINRRGQHRQGRPALRHGRRRPDRGVASRDTRSRAQSRGKRRGTVPR